MGPSVYGDSMIRVALLSCAAVTVQGAPALGGASPEKTTAAAWVDEQALRLEAVSTSIWELAELALKEHESSRLLASLLEESGFSVRRGVSDMPTAFVAEWGSGRPVIGILAEFDALPGLSQTVTAQREARLEGGGGHGCGHNLFGTASTAAAVAMKTAMERHGLEGTVRLYGTPAEEQGIGKIFMVRDGLFDDVDACLSWHPDNENKVRLQPSKALRSFEVTFYGRSAHAAGAPWEGVSALDAVEAFASGVNLLREHMPETARIHYVITDGGEAPNIVPSRARIWVFVRGKDWPEEEKVFRHVRGIIEGADRMAWGEEYERSESGFRPAEIVLLSGLYEYNINLAGSQVMQRNLELVGAPAFTKQEQAFARKLQKAFGLPQEGMATTIVPFDPNRTPEPGGSTDVANVSWVTPTVGLRMANWPIECPAHSWASTAASGSSAAHRAMISAAKVLALTGIELLNDPEAINAMRAEFEASRKNFDYEPPIGRKDRPTLPTHMR